jgi:SAM-dependent methyltransferase
MKRAENAAPEFGMAYYDRIAKKWHAVTGFRGGAFKRCVLNDRLRERIRAIDRIRILELGAGNGYFLKWLVGRFSGQVPNRVVVTDCSGALLDLAQRHFPIGDAEYRLLDIRSRLPLSDRSFDVILATMVFNEVSTSGLRRALRECHRVLDAGGRLIATVTHPAFIESLARRGELRKGTRGMLTMPGAEGLRLPVFRRSVQEYQDLLCSRGFDVEHEDVSGSEEVLREKPGLRKAGKIALALILDCTKAPTEGG